MPKTYIQEPPGITISAMPGGSCLVRADFRLRLHAIVLVRYGQFLATFGATGSQYTTAIGGSHSLTETVFVSSLSVGGLECSFHCCIFFYVIILCNSGCKSRDFLRNNQRDNSFSLKSFVFLPNCITFAAEKRTKSIARSPETDNTNIII